MQFIVQNSFPFFFFFLKYLYKTVLVIINVCSELRDLEIIPSDWDGWEGNPPVYPIYEHYYRYVFAAKNFLDLVTIVPFYFQDMIGSSGGGATIFLRVFRLIKIARLLKGLLDPCFPRPDYWGKCPI